MTVRWTEPAVATKSRSCTVRAEQKHSEEDFSLRHKAATLQDKKRETNNTDKSFYSALSSSSWRTELELLLLLNGAVGSNGSWQGGCWKWPESHAGSEESEEECRRGKEEEGAADGGFSPREDASKEHLSQRAAGSLIRERELGFACSCVWVCMCVWWRESGRVASVVTDEPASCGMNVGHSLECSCLSLYLSVLPGLCVCL